MTNKQILEDASEAGFRIDSFIVGSKKYVQICAIDTCCKVELTKFAELTKARAQLDNANKPMGSSMQGDSEPIFKREADEKAGWIIDSELVYQVSRKAGSLGAEFGVDMEQAEQVMLALETMPECLPSVISMQTEKKNSDDVN